MRATSNLLWFILMASQVLCLCCGGFSKTHEKSLCRDLQAMGTVARVEIFHPDSTVAELGLDAVMAVFDSINALMSVWDPGSEISQLNRAPAGSTVTLSRWLNECLSSAEEIRGTTGGAFDPSLRPLMHLWGFYRKADALPSKAEVDSVLSLIGRYTHDPGASALFKDRGGTSFDLGGIAKGFAVDRASEALRRLGIENALIDLGGNLYCMGVPGGKDHWKGGVLSGRERWRVGIRDPLDKNELLAAVETEERAFATSGSYERFVMIDGRRYSHIMNPATGYPVEGLLSVTVVASNATLADGLSTAFFVLGFDGARRVLPLSYPDTEAVFVLPSEGERKARVAASRALEGRIRLLPRVKSSYSLEFF